MVRRPEGTARPADAAALAGSVYLPNDFPTGRAQAIFVAAENGYKNGVNATVVATQEPQPSRIRVTVTSTVTNFFAGLVGYNTETISRDVVADFQGPVPMGSPTSGLGQDPDEGDLQNFWLNTSGPGGTKREGDRFATKICNDSARSRGAAARRASITTRTATCSGCASGPSRPASLS